MQTRSAFAKENIRTDEAQVIHLSHETAVIFGIILQCMNVGKRRRHNETIAGSAEVGYGSRTCPVRVMRDLHVFFDKIDIILLRLNIRFCRLLYCI